MPGSEQLTVFHGGYSSGCIESAKQPSSSHGERIKNNLHYITQNYSARDFSEHCYINAKYPQVAAGRGCLQSTLTTCPTTPVY